MGKITPRYVLYEGEYVNVSKFADSEKRARPHVLCPECNEVVTLKLGEQLRHHYAHQEGSDCTISLETALHINTKYALRDLFFEHKDKDIWVKVQCEDCGEYSIAVQYPVSSMNWETAYVEHYSNPYKIDLALVGKETMSMQEYVALAVEVLNTHAVDDEKISHFKSIAVPWVEVDSHDFYPAEVEISGKRIMLEAVRAGGLGMFSSKCEPCQKARDRQKKRQEQDSRDNYKREFYRANKKAKCAEPTSLVRMSTDQQVRKLERVVARFADSYDYQRPYVWGHTYFEMYFTYGFFARQIVMCVQKWHPSRTEIWTSHGAIALREGGDARAAWAHHEVKSYVRNTLIRPHEVAYWTVNPVVARHGEWEWVLDYLNEPLRFNWKNDEWILQEAS